MPTRNYAVFAGSNFYPGGGAHDFLGCADDLNHAWKLVDEARDRAKEHGQGDMDAIDWCHALDLASGELIERPDHRSSSPAGG